MLDEMVSMSSDFQKKRKWNENESTVYLFFMLELFKTRKPRPKLRKNVEKIIEFIQKTLLEGKRKQAMGLHLSFIQLSSL